MESVLSVYQRTYHDDFPFVCLDETLKQLVKETRTPIPTQSAKPDGRNRMAEIELSVLSRQCLNRRIPDMTTLREEVTAWYKERNEKETWIDWRFTTKDARIKLKKLYPSINH